MRATHADRGKTGNYTYLLTPLDILFPLPTLTHIHARMNSARARKWSRKKLSDTARGRPTEPREHLRIAHLSVNATKLHQKSKFRLILVMMGFSLSNPERSVQRNKGPHETWSQICTTHTYTILAISISLAISHCTSSEST